MCELALTLPFNSWTRVTQTGLVSTLLGPPTRYKRYTPAVAEKLNRHG